MKEVAEKIAEFRRELYGLSVRQMEPNGWPYPNPQSDIGPDTVLRIGQTVWVVDSNCIPWEGVIKARRNGDDVFSVEAADPDLTNVHNGLFRLPALHLSRGSAYQCALSALNELLAYVTEEFHAT